MYVIDLEYLTTCNLSDTYIISILFYYPLILSQVPWIHCLPFIFFIQLFFVIAIFFSISYFRQNTLYLMDLSVLISLCFSSSLIICLFQLYCIFNCILSYILFNYWYSSVIVTIIISIIFTISIYCFFCELRY